MPPPPWNRNLPVHSRSAAAQVGLHRIPLAIGPRPFAHDADHFAVFRHRRQPGPSHGRGAIGLRFDDDRASPSRCASSARRVQRRSVGSWRARPHRGRARESAFECPAPARSSRPKRNDERPIECTTVRYCTLSSRKLALKGRCRRSAAGRGPPRHRRSSSWQSACRRALRNRTAANGAIRPRWDHRLLQIVSNSQP